MSVSYTISKNAHYTFIDNTYILEYIDSMIEHHNPFVIFSLSPSYIQAMISIDLNMKTKRLRPEQLIGIVCGYFAAVFLIITVVILIWKKKNDDSFTNKETHTHQTIETTVEFNNENQNQIVNADMWI